MNFFYTPIFRPLCLPANKALGADGSLIPQFSSGKFITQVDFVVNH